jgi:hypothetical protein
VSKKDGDELELRERKSGASGMEPGNVNNNIEGALS